MMPQPPGKYWGSERHEKWGHHWAKGCNPHWPNGSRHCQEMGRNRGEYEHVMIWYEMMLYSTPFISILLPYSVLYYNITLYYISIIISISLCIYAVSLRGVQAFRQYITCPQDLAGDWHRRAARGRRRAHETWTRHLWRGGRGGWRQRCLGWTAAIIRPLSTIYLEKMRETKGAAVVDSEWFRDNLLCHEMLQMANARLALRFLRFQNPSKIGTSLFYPIFMLSSKKGLKTVPWWSLIFVFGRLPSFATRVLRGLDVTRITRLLWDHLPSEACSFVQEYTAEARRTRKVVAGPVDDRWCLFLFRV